MARLAVSKDYFGAYARLPRKAQRKADEFLAKFQRDSTTLSIHLEPIHGVIDSQLRSARIGDDYRVILRAPPTGDVFLVLWADHHDEAYRWAATKQTAVHPATGSLQIFVATLASEPVAAPSADAGTRSQPMPAREAPSPTPSPASPPAGLFSNFDDSSLFLAGVPSVLLPSVRAIASDSDLDAMLPHLPPEAGEVLTGLAAGLSLDDALEEVLGRLAPPAGAPVPPPIDVTDVAAALGRESTQRQFRLLEGELDLDAALKHPLDVWRVFLHPRQRRLAQARTKGPVRVLGGAGTGKTVVALHRAAFLVREAFTKPDDRVLFTTFNVNLANDLKSQLAKLLEPDELARVEVVNIDAWASGLLRKKGIVLRTAFEDDQREHFQSAYNVYGDDEHALDFYRAEWREVIQEQGLATEEEYVRAVRKHRGIPLGRAERRKLWPVFQAYRDSLEREGLLEPVDVLRRARKELEAASAPPRYQSVVVDEVQDFSPEALKLLRAIAGPERPDDLFLVGDAHQRIYRRPTSLSSCGIQVRGRRSQTLRLNYRTTGAICRWSLGVLDGVEVDDLDDGKADRRGYVSLREGPPPTVQCLATQIDEERAVVDLVRNGLELGWTPESVCIVARTHRTLTERFAPALAKEGIESVPLEKDEPRRGGVRLATMHRVKGLEFPVVILVGMAKNELPLPSPELNSDAPLVAEQALLRERSLLYVAASRARDELYVFAAGTLSSLLSGWTALATKPASPRPVTPKTLAPRTVPPPPASVAPPSATLPSVAPPAGVRPSSAPPSVAPVESTGDADLASLRAGPVIATVGGSPSPPVSAELARILALPLGELELPTRMANFAERKGLETLSDLVKWTPAALMAEKNVGRGTVRGTRHIIEDLTSRSWESLSSLDLQDALEASTDDPNVDEGEDSPGFAPGSWAALCASLTDAQRATRLDDMTLPARARSFAVQTGLTTLGELASCTLAELRRADNLGRKTLQELPPSIREYFESRRPDEQLGEQGLLECWKALLEGLEGVPRIILTRRSGLGGPSETLKEIGEMLGVSRERIRQIEAATSKALVRRAWVEVVRRRVDAALVDGATLLDDLARDPWWAAAVGLPEVARYVIEDVVEANAFVISFDDLDWLSRYRESEVHAAWNELRAEAAAIVLPAPKSAFDELIGPMEARVDTRLAAHFAKLLGETMILDTGSEPGGPRVLALGDGRIAKLMAFLRSAKAPVHTDEAMAFVGGRHHFPEEIVRFGESKIGLRQHIPDFDEWRARLVPRAVEIVRDTDPERQWSCTEIHDELREEFALPEWLNPFVLAALIKAGPELTYLGRLRVVLLGSKDNADRIYVHELLEQLLRDAGEPLARDELVARIRVRIGISDFAINQAFTRPQFVRMDLDRVGLLDRDVLGGQPAIDEARDEIAAILERRGRGLSMFHVHEELVRLSAVHAEWNQEVSYSVLHGDPRFRFSTSGAVGLAAWESTRVPTRLELVRSALEESGGRVSVEAITARIEAHYGEPIGRGFLASIAMKLGASLAGEWVVRKSEG
ncbi:MAG: UvrD-helicase domain-containing protein [Deltaproteobacteria bacterium]